MKEKKSKVCFVISLCILEELMNSELLVIETFPELHSQFSVLAKYEVEIDDDVFLQLKTLTQTWNDYGHELEDSEFALKKIKVFSIMHFYGHNLLTRVSM